MTGVTGATESLAWEYEAFEKIKTRFTAEWGELQNRFQSLQEANKEIYQHLTQNTLLMRPVNNSPSLEIRRLFRLVHEGILFKEPFLYRIFLYDAIDPSDIHSRAWLFENYLSYRVLGSVRDILSDQVSQELRTGRDLTKSRVYRWLCAYVDNCDHYRLIDMVKETGAEEPVEELREARIYQSTEGLVFDYSPIFKFVHAGNNRILEYLNREDYERELNKYDQYARDADSIILSTTEKERTNPDRHSKPTGGSLGTSMEHSRHNLTIRYEGLSRTIPFQFGYKYRPKINQEGWEHSSPHLTKTELVSEALQGLLKGMASWDRKRGTATNWISENIRWQTGSAKRDALKSKQQELLRYPEEIKDDTSIDSIGPGGI